MVEDQLMRARCEVTHSEEETIELGRRIARELPARAVVLLIGNLGAGKTTLAKGILSGLGVAEPDDVASPTFTLIHEYGGGRAYHVDLYRLDRLEQVATLGLDEIFDREAVVLIEWGERFPQLLPPDAIRLHLRALEGDSREIVIEGSRMATVHHLLTYEEWLKLPPVEDGTDEVVKGELRFTPPTQYPHAEVVQRLLIRLSRQLDERRVAILGSNFGLMISRDPLTCRSPDLAVYWREKMEIKDGLYWSAPDLIVEVISPSETKRHKEEKLADYASIGVPEVWLASPEAQTVEVRILKSGRFERTSIFADGVLKPSRFPGVSVPASELWPEN
jgi:tRNA threonylcarbamoyladenosine biosynthesis protein TsaE